MENVVRFQQVTKQIDDFTLGPVSIDIPTGFVTALVGPNGAGKSTLLKMMMQLVKQDKGTYQLRGEKVDNIDDTWKKDISYLPQKLSGPIPYTGEQWREIISTWYDDWDESLYEQLVRQFDVATTKQMEKLSPGDQQKMKLALTIPRNTPFLILDEPTSFLDIPAKKVLMDVLIEWLDAGERSILLATHQVEDIRKLADYLVVLKKGKTLGMFEKEELTEKYQRFWVRGNIPTEPVPGEIERDGNTFVTKCAPLAEMFLEKRNIQWETAEALELEEIITYMITKE